MGRIRQILWVARARRLILLFTLGIVVPGTVLGVLSLRGLEGDRIAEEAMLRKQNQAVADQLSAQIAGAVDAVIDPIRTEVSGLELAGVEDIRALEPRLAHVQDMYPVVHRFFLVSGQTWDLLWPRAPETSASSRPLPIPGNFDIQEVIDFDDPRDRAEGLLGLWTRLSAVRQEHDVRQTLGEVERRLQISFASDTEGRLGDVATEYDSRQFQVRYSSEICDRIRQSQEEAALGDVRWETLSLLGPPILYGTVAMQGHSPPFYLGFVIDIERLQGEVLPAVVGSGRRGDTRVGVFDRKKRTLAGQVPGDFLVAKFSAGGGVPPWEIQVAADSEAFHRRFFRRQVTLLGLVSFLAVALAVGAGLTVRGVVREMEALQARSDFVANVSHELKTPLTSIRMFSEMIESGRAPTPEKQKEYAHLISREGERLRALIENVLDFSRLERGVEGAAKTPQPIGEFVRQAVDGCRRHLLVEGCDLEVEIQNDLPSVPIDAEGLGRALVNLLGNAMKFSEKEKWIAVRARREGEEVFIEVSDHGPGIPRVERERIFDKF